MKPNDATMWGAGPDLSSRGAPAVRECIEGVDVSCSSPSLGEACVVVSCPPTTTRVDVATAPLHGVVLDPCDLPGTDACVLGALPGVHGAGCVPPMVGRGAACETFPAPRSSSPWALLCACLIATLARSLGSAVTWRRLSPLVVARLLYPSGPPSLPWPAQV